MSEAPSAAPSTIAPAPRRAAWGVVGRLGWGVADQAVSSLSNFALGLYAARSLGPTGFGAFTLAYVSYTVVINAARGTATDPLLVRFSGATGDSWRRASSAASATALSVGTAAGLLSVLAGLLLPGPVGDAFLALGPALPGLTLQDSWRFAFFAQGRGSRALINDLVWTALLVAALVGLAHGGNTTVAGCLLVFGGSAWVAGFVGIAQAGVLPRPSTVPGWVREHRELSGRYLVENVTASGASQIRSFVLGGLAGLAAVGYVRGAEILMGPFLVVLMGISQVAVPEASKIFQRSADRLIHFCLVLGGAQAAAAAAWGLVLAVVLPLGLGQLVLNEVWEGVGPLVPAVTLTVVAACFLTAATAGLRAMGVARRSLRVQLVTSTVYVLFSAAGAAYGGALGVCWAAVVAYATGGALGWHNLRSALADHRREATGGA